jgi:hypothetical protein
MPPPPNHSSSTVVAGTTKTATASTMPERRTTARTPGNWSPVVRERAAMALGRRKRCCRCALIDMLASPSLDARYGACQGLIFLRGRGAPAVDALQKTLADEDLWLRIKAAEALAAIGKPATKTVPQLLELLAQVDEKNDPRGMQQRYLTLRCLIAMDAQSLAGRRGSRGALQGREGRIEEPGRTRSRQHRFRLSPSLARTRSSRCCQPSTRPSSNPRPAARCSPTAFAWKACVSCSQHHIEEGMQALVIYTRDQNPWASEIRTPELMKILLATAPTPKRSFLN